MFGNDDSLWPRPGHHDVVQVALMNASAEKLKALVANCRPAIFCVEAIKEISIRGETYLAPGWAADAVIDLVAPCCQRKELADQELYDITNERQTGEVKLARKQGQVSFCDAEGKRTYAPEAGFFTKTQGLDRFFLFQSLQAIRLRLQGWGCSSATIEALLQLPKSSLERYDDSLAAWLEVDFRFITDDNAEVVRRRIRLGQHGSACVILFQTWVPPQCWIHFPDKRYQILIEIKVGDFDGFGNILRQINRYKAKLQTERAILICESLEPGEVQGFIRQGVSIYPVCDLLSYGH